MDEDAKVGVRELRQNLSKYLRRVQRGETLEVTDHGQSVAVLAPLPKSDSVLDRLIAEGKATPARTSLEDLPPPLPRTEGMTLSEALAALREDER